MNRCTQRLSRRVGLREGGKEGGEKKNEKRGLPHPPPPPPVNLFYGRRQEIPHPPRTALCHHLRLRPLLHHVALQSESQQRSNLNLRQPPLRARAVAPPHDQTRVRFTVSRTKQRRNDIITICERIVSFFNISFT
jgi:hypothetical protein